VVPEWNDPLAKLKTAVSGACESPWNDRLRNRCLAYGISDGLTEMR